MYPGFVPELLVLLHPVCYSSSSHHLSLCLVCLLSQLLSKKRGLFRIHAGRKQRYPWQQACARGILLKHAHLAWNTRICGPVHCFVFLTKSCTYQLSTLIRHYSGPQILEWVLDYEELLCYSFLKGCFSSSIFPAGETSSDFYLLLLENQDKPCVEKTSVPFSNLLTSNISKETRK